jgi:hypothetical protein
MKYLIILSLLAGPAFSANWYVLKSASGANNGTSWTNAWNEMNKINLSSVACGDTIWLGGGTYTTGLTINKTCTAGAVLNINRVLATDAAPVAAAGWNSSFASQVILSDSSIDLFSGSYFNINGRVGTVAANNFGISVRCNGGSGCVALNGADYGGGSLNHITISYLELYGPPCVTAGSCTSGSDGFNIAPSNAANTVNYVTLDHSWVHRFSETIRAALWNNCTIQYSDIDTMAFTPAEHEDILFSYDQVNFTFRYNRVYTSPNDGIFFYGDEKNTQIYGNVIYHSGGALLTFYQGFTHNVFVYNNVFENDGKFGDYQPGYVYFISGATVTGEVANNIFDNVTISGSCGSICNHNAYSTTVSAQDSGAGTLTFNTGTVGASVMFVNEAPSNPAVADFHLTAKGATTFANGKSLAAPFNVDMDGVTRGTGGTWTIGAYQYTGGSTTPPTAPAPPTNLTLVVH